MTQRVKNGNPANYNASPATRTDGEDSALEVDEFGNLKSTLATGIAGENLNEGLMRVRSEVDLLTGVPVSASAILKTGVGRLSGFVVTASSSGVIKIWKNTAASGDLMFDSLSVTAGQVIAIPNGMAGFSIGLYFELVSGTATISFFGN